MRFSISPCRSTPAKDPTRFLTSDEKISINTKKELRAKKVEYNFKVSNADENERQKSISEIMDKHQKIHDNISSHLKKELNTQENEFEKKMERRRERSVSRSMNKSVERKPSRFDADKDEDVRGTGNILEKLQVNNQKKLHMANNPFKDEEF